MEEFEGRRRGMLTMGEWCNPVSNMLYHQPCVKRVECGLGTRGLRMVGAFWTGISIEVTQKAGVIPLRRRAATETPF